MLDKKLQVETFSIVLIGKFNPAIFQPFWFSSKGLLGENETKNANINIIHPEIARYSIDNWLDIEVTKNRCEFKSKMQPYFSSLIDLVVSTFKLLCETPIDAFGINNIFEVSLSSEKEYYDFGKKLTPLELWKDSLTDPRLLTLEILEQKIKDYENASRRVRISPCDPSKNITYGVMINVNNHFVLTDQKSSSAVSILENKADTIREYSQTIADTMLTKLIEL